MNRTVRTLVALVLPLVTGGLAIAQATPAPKPDDREALVARYGAAQRKYLAGDAAAKEAARAEMQAVSDAAPKDFELAVSIARWLARDELDFAGAEPFARRAVALQPRSSEAVRLLGVALIESKKFADAEQAYRSAAEQSPQDGSLHYGLGLALGRQHKFSEAHDAYAKALEREPENGLYHFAAGENLANLRDFAKAEQQFALAVKWNGHVDAMWKLGEALAKEGKDAQAERALKQAVSSGPKATRFNAALQLGVFLFERGRNLEAQQALVVATKLDPLGREAWNWLARTERALGHEDAAAKALARYQQLREKADADEDEHLLGLIRSLMDEPKKEGATPEAPKPEPKKDEPKSEPAKKDG
jgi:Flp pilus assembly protein TadD